MTPEREAEIIKQLEYSEGELPAIQALIKARRRGVYLLSTGKIVDANWGILGLNFDGDLTEGYDGIIEYHDSAGRDPELGGSVLTPAERVEIADIVIKQWTEFREKWACP